MASLLLGLTTAGCVGSTDLNMRLFSSINAGHYDGAVTALRDGASPNARDVNGNTALHNAAAFNRIEIARLLIESGARLDARRGAPLVGMAETPLMWAAKHNSFGVARLLMERGASRGRFLFYGSAEEFARNTGQTEMADFISTWKPVSR